METLVPLLRDPMARTVLAVVAICVTVSLFLLGQRLRRKALTYTISETRVLSVHEEIKGRVQILFDGAPARDVCLFMITINNSGSEPIRAEDFERPLGFQWEGPAQILTADLVSARPTSLRPVIKTGVSEIALEPLLLNGGDWLQIKALVNESGAGACSVDGRIVGVKKLKQGTADPSVRVQTRFFGGILALPILALVGRMLGLWAPDGPAEKSIILLMVLCMLMFLLELLKLNLKGLRDYYRKKQHRSK
jgi:hypothetical protein